MKVLTATVTDQGARDGDFTWTVEGELVRLGEPCERDVYNPQGGCGCSRSFSALSSLRATTTALVRDLDLSRADVQAALHGSLVSAGYLGEVVDAEQRQGLDAEIDFLLEVATACDTGAVLGRSFDELFVRASAPVEH